jgi:hypothetical protein
MFINFLTKKESKSCVEYTAERKINYRTAIAKAAFNKKENLFTSKLDLNLGKKVMKCYACCKASYDAKTWILWRAIRNTLKVLKCSAGEGFRSFGPILSEMSNYGEE